MPRLAGGPISQGFFFQHITLSSKDLNHEWFVCIYDATIKCARLSLTLCARVFYRWNTYYHMRVYFNFHWHCYIQNKPIAKMFIAIVNTCSMYSLLLFVALFPWWAPSRVKTPVPYKHKATGIDASTRTTIIVAVDTCFARIEWHCFRQYARRRKQRSRAVAPALALWSTATIEAETKDAARPRRHCTWCARIAWHCFSDSSAGPPCDVHIMFMYVVGRILVVELRCGALLVGYENEVCHLPSALLVAPWYRRTRVTRGPHRQRQACPIWRHEPSFDANLSTERAQFCVLVQEFQDLELWFWHWKNSSFVFAWSGQNVLTFRYLILWHLEVFFRYLNRSRCVTWRRAISSVESSVLSTKNTV